MISTIRFGHVAPVNTNATQPTVEVPETEQMKPAVSKDSDTFTLTKAAGDAKTADAKKAAAEALKRMQTETQGVIATSIR